MSTTIPKLAKTIFSTGPDVKLATTDVYSESPDTKSAINVPDIAKNVAAEISKAGVWLGSTDGLLSVLKSVKVDRNGIKLDSKALTDRLIQASGGPNSPFYDLKNKADSLKQLAVSTALGQAANLVAQQPNLAIAYKNITTIVDATKDIDSINDLSKLINTIATNDEFAKVIDLRAQFSILSSIMSESSRLGITGVIDSVVDNITDTKDKKKFLLSELNTYLKYCNLEAITKCVSLAGGKAILARAPDAINQILTNYRFATTTKPSQYADLLDDLVALLTSIDSHWNQYIRAGVWVSNLEPFTKISNDAKSLFMVSDDYWDKVALAPDYPAKSIKELAKINYPFLAV